MSEKKLKSETIKLFLKCEFSQDEILRKGIELARLNLDKTRIDNEKKAVVSEYKAKLDGKDAEIAVIGNQISNGFEHRNVECQIDWHSPTTGKKTTTRLDTNEVIRIESMTAEEMQMEIEFEPVEQTKQVEPELEIE